MTTEIVVLPIYSMVILHCFLYVFQRVTPIFTLLSHDYPNINMVHNPMIVPWLSIWFDSPLIMAPNATFGHAIGSFNLRSTFFRWPSMVPRARECTTHESRGDESCETVTVLWRNVGWMIKSISGWWFQPLINYDRWLINVNYSYQLFIAHFINYWLVVYLPLWKIWVRQLGSLFPIWYGTIKKCSKPPTSIYFIYLLVNKHSYETSPS